MNVTLRGGEDDEHEEEDNDKERNKNTCNAQGAPHLDLHHRPCAWKW